MMPGPYSSPQSLVDAETLAHKLKVSIRVISITEPFALYQKLLAPKTLLSSLTLQNLQARIRGQILMTLANETGALLLATANKSELSVGYSTLYGDSCGALSPIGDCYKSWVYHLAAAVNETQEIIPQAILSKAPSAELRAGQKDEDDLGPYRDLDQLLFLFIEQKQSLETIVQATGFKRDWAKSTLERITRAEFKRRQTPFSLLVSEVGFSDSFRYPITQKWI
jgi:NAD+ synthase (glutamine-hydrolysing)